MNYKTFLIIMIIVSSIIFFYLIFIRFSIEQNENYFHSKMLLSIKDLPDGYHLSTFGPLKKILYVNNTKVKGYYVQFESDSFGKIPTFIYQENVIFSGYNNEWIGETMLSTWNNTGTDKQGNIWTFKKIDIPKELKSIGDYNLLLFGNSSFNRGSLSSVDFYFTKGETYQRISIAGPSESVSINDLVKLARILQNFTSNSS